MALFDSIESFSCAFNVIRSERGTMSAKGEDCSSSIWETVDNVFLTGITNMSEDKIVESSANERMRVGDLVWPKIKDLACPRRNVANDPQVVHEGIELASSRDKVSWVGKLAKVGISGILQKSLCQIFNWWIGEISSG